MTLEMRLQILINENVVFKRRSKTRDCLVTSVFKFKFHLSTSASEVHRTMYPRN